MHSIIFALFLVFVPIGSEAALYKDTSKMAPVWSRPAMSMHHIFIIQKIMGIETTLDILPSVRMWSNVSSVDRAKCPECDGSYDVIIDDEIWLRDNATRRDMILMIVKFYQLNVTGIPYSMIDSDVAANEREFIANRWESTVQTNRERRPIADVP